MNDCLPGPSRDGGVTGPVLAGGGPDHDTGLAITGPVARPHLRSAAGNPSGNGAVPIMSI